jgi:hypothetical protein
MGVSSNGTFFQYDEAKPHTTNAVLHVLSEYFLSKVLSKQLPACFRCGQSWTTYFSDISPCDLVLQCFLKNTFYRNNPLRVQELKQNISVAVSASMNAYLLE